MLVYEEILCSRNRDNLRVAPCMALAHEAGRILYWHSAMEEYEERKSARGVRRPWQGHETGHSLLWLAQLFYEIISKNIYHLTSFQQG